MQADAHHPGCLVALGVEHIESIAQVAEKMLAGVEALWRREAHVVGVERIRHDQALQHAAVGSGHRHPERQVVAVVVAVVLVAAVVGHQAFGVGAVAPGVPTQRPLAVGQLANGAGGDLDMAALLRLVHVLVMNPAPAVAGDLMALLGEPVREFGVALQRHRHAEHGQRQSAFFKLAQDAPHPGARAVFVHRLHRQVPRLEGRRADDLGQKSLRRRVAVQHAVLAAFFIVEDELHRDAGLSGPVRMRWCAAVADQVARIDFGRHGAFKKSSTRAPLQGARHFEPVASRLI